MAEITWIKLRTDMFDNTKIRLIEKLPEGDTILVIWVKLLAAAGKANCNGYIMLSENIPMNIEEMAVIFDRPLNTVRLALEAFKRYGMVEVDENEIIRIHNWEKHQNVDGMEKIRLQTAARVAKHREKKKAEQALPLPKNEDNATCNVTVTQSNETEQTKTRLDKDLDIDKDIQQTVSQSSVASQKLFTFFTTRLNRFASEQLREDINFYLETYYDADLIIEAFNRSLADGRVKAKEKYALGTLRNWKHEGVLSYELLQQKEAAQNATISQGYERPSNNEYDNLSL
ncbi:phage replisome organizer N-terminal domain-containing protein [Lysinibacillus sp. CD3-6]|uniref:phage replisome organizer N-terminal domain-containing protein n=1 Tax=Lysinibacillus sp. CD3-6 TaxID=2892541 RepID=UPI00111F049A|nr:phage replisome organizer N-terminal domain-containing protein [Lysinibacillus sp. CD3-6]UED81055.1 phage replisome organizer N-terminal domain-containing protein [Lysinibacillus sp. CD3-6]